MSNGFIKLNRCPETEYLMENHPNAFLLLTQIALRARRTAGHPDGREVGESEIGDYWKAGIPGEKAYRTAKDVLERRLHIQIVETCRKRKKGATAKATNGTLVKLLESSIWDINPEYKGDLKGDRGATEGRPKGDEQEYKEVKKDKKSLSKDKEYIPTAVAVSLSDLFISNIKSYHPAFKEPSDMKKSAKAIDDMIRLDKREPEEIKAVIQWLPSHNFWRGVVLSTLKLRKHFDSLAIACNANEKGDQNNEAYNIRPSKQPKNNYQDVTSRAYSNGQRLTEYDNL